MASLFCLATLVMTCEWHVNKNNVTLFHWIPWKFSSRVMKAFNYHSCFALVNNTDAFITLNENIYGIHSKRVSIRYFVTRDWRHCRNIRYALVLGTLVYFWRNLDPIWWPWNFNEGYFVSCIIKLYHLPLAGLIHQTTNWWNFSSLFFSSENRIWHFMQTVSDGDNLHEMSNHVFWEKNKKNILKCRLLKILPLC